jgi:hypothetical protein
MKAAVRVGTQSLSFSLCALERPTRRTRLRRSFALLRRYADTPNRRHDSPAPALYQAIFQTGDDRGCSALQEHDIDHWQSSGSRQPGERFKMIGNTELSSERDTETGFDCCPGSGETRTTERLFPLFLAQQCLRSFPKKAGCGKQDHPNRFFRAKPAVDNPLHRQPPDPRRWDADFLPGKKQREIEPTSPDSLQQIDGTFDLDFDFNRGMGARESRQDPGKNRLGEILKQTEPHGASDAGPGNGEHRFIVEREHPPGIVHENSAGDRQGDSSAVSFKGCRADHFFESIHLQADRGLGSPNPYRRLLEASGLRSPEESPEQIQIKEWFAHS